MRLAIKPLAIALLALLPATPTSAVAAKPQKTAFSIDIEILRSALGENDPPGGIDLTGKFRASGALSDSGSATINNHLWPFGPLYLESKKGSLEVSITPDEYPNLAGTFTIAGTGGAYSELLESGTATGTTRLSKNRKWFRLQWHLRGTLSGG